MHGGVWASQSCVTLLQMPTACLRALFFGCVYTDGAPAWPEEAECTLSVWKVGRLVLSLSPGLALRLGPCPVQSHSPSQWISVFLMHL